jgi:hypothetical protein
MVEILSRNERRWFIADGQPGPRRAGAAHSRVAPAHLRTVGPTPEAVAVGNGKILTVGILTRLQTTQAPVPRS